ncbi:MAG: 16S rRNA (guanine(966)-N(2))-methyltransferase RsmD [Succinivibrio sp.]|nr:16S rRNA (guanine(966)-N(2))-methyltransferase RsmD [Succinivibrio sp.]
MKHSGEVRIIGGKLKGKLLPVYEAEGLRPTPDRVRETLFSWLDNYLDAANVLDLFAGSGALGFEAYSRGAAKVTLVEINEVNYRSLSKIASSIDNQAITVVNQDANNFLSNTHDVYDIVFLDPPYNSELLKNVLSSLVKNNLVNEQSVIYVEMRDGHNEAVPGYEIIREQSAGQAKYALWKKSSFLF